MIHYPGEAAPEHIMEIFYTVGREARDKKSEALDQEETDKNMDVIQGWIVKTGTVMRHIIMFHSMRDRI